MSKLYLDKVEPDILESFWHIIGPLLDKVSPYTAKEYSIDDVKQLILNRSEQCWVAFNTEGIKAAMTTRILSFPQKEVLHISRLYSDVPFEDIEDMLIPIIEWAKPQGCSEVRLEGRRGWLKKLPDWKEEYTIMNRRI